MSIFAISDLHLSGQPPQKPMDVFGSHWHNHFERIRASWLEQVSPTDTVLLAGDTSWAMKLPDALPDLEALIALPGRKILIRGNHDYWWQTVSKMSALTQGKLLFLSNNFHVAEGYAIVGSRGWLLPEDHAFDPEQDQPIYQRELLRLSASITAAVQAGHKKLIAMLHYPPLYYDRLDSGFSSLLTQANIKHCVYGHLHGDATGQGFQGWHQGTQYLLTSCDALQFRLAKIL